MGFNGQSRKERMKILQDLMKKLKKEEEKNEENFILNKEILKESKKIHENYS